MVATTHSTARVERPNVSVALVTLVISVRLISVVQRDAVATEHALLAFLAEIYQ